MVAVSYTLLIDGAPASPDLMAAIQQIEVEENAGMADMLRLRLGIGVDESGSDWTILGEDIFPRLANIQILVTVGSGRAVPLIDAYVIETNMAFSNEPGQSVLSVVAMDPTVHMNLEEKVRAWRDMADGDIATQIFGEHGFVADVERTQPTRQQLDTTTIQRGTDIQFLRKLARRNGYECYVESNPSTGMIEGHFHPARLEQIPQDVLLVNMGPATNVNTFTARHDMLGPTTAEATGLDIETQADQAAEVESASLTELGGDPSLTGEEPRRVLLSRTGLAQAGELQTFAQAVVDRSAWAILAEGELNTASYEGLLRAKRLVEVRGVGQDFSGRM
ncbi:MAG: phage late control D family protein [Dehalococcoidia bacterium]